MVRGLCGRPPPRAPHPPKRVQKMDEMGHDLPRRSTRLISGEANPRLDLARGESPRSDRKRRAPPGREALSLPATSRSATRARHETPRIARPQMPASRRRLRDARAHVRVPRCAPLPSSNQLNRSDLRIRTLYVVRRARQQLPPCARRHSRPTPSPRAFGALSARRLRVGSFALLLRSRCRRLL